MLSLVKRLMGRRSYSGSTSAIKSGDPCSVCPQPCHLHEAIPSSILSKVDHCKPLYPTVKEHVAHLFILTPPTILSAKDWPAELVLDAGPAQMEEGHDDIVQSLQRYVTLLKEHVELAKAVSQRNILLTLAESNDVIDNMTPPSLRPLAQGSNPSFHLMLFPQRLLLPKIAMSDLKLQAGASSFLAPFFSPQLPDATKSIHYMPLDPSKFFIFVCSHMNRDKRCGVLGLPILDAIETWSEQQTLTQKAKISAHACSHIGGHKFAGNLIIYPNGDWYGRVTPCHIPDLLQRHLGQGVIIDSLYRGSVSSIVQKEF